MKITYTIAQRTNAGMVFWGKDGAFTPRFKESLSFVVVPKLYTSHLIKDGHENLSVIANFGTDTEEIVDIN